MKRRYSYTLSNAGRFLPVYDNLLSQIKNKNPVIGLTISKAKIEATGMSLSTFQQRLVDGLKFLAERYKETTAGLIDLKYQEEDYIMLKAMIKTGLEDDFIMIGVKQSPTFFSSIQSQMTTIDARGDIISGLKKEILAFLADKSLPVGQFKNIAQPVSKEDIDWLYSEVQQSLGMALVWGELNKSLTIVK